MSALGLIVNAKAGAVMPRYKSLKEKASLAFEGSGIRPVVMISETRWPCQQSHEQ